MPHNLYYAKKKKASEITPLHPAWFLFCSCSFLPVCERPPPPRAPQFDVFNMFKSRLVSCSGSPWCQLL